jgi:hypothetical protein
MQGVQFGMWPSAGSEKLLVTNKDFFPKIVFFGNVHYFIIIKLIFNCA